MSGETSSDPRVDQLSLEAILNGELTLDDVRIHPDSLRRQAKAAERYGNPQLAENLLRAAELAALSDVEVLEIYEALRPRRATRAQLETIAKRLDSANASRCATLVREAAEAYDRRGILP